MKLIEIKINRNRRLKIVLYAINKNMKIITVAPNKDSVVFTATLSAKKSVDLLYILKNIISRKKTILNETSNRVYQPLRSPEI